MHPFRSSVALALLLIAAACADDAARYPSLARRPIESDAGAPAATTTPAAQTAPADPAIETQVTAEAARLDSGSATFGRALADTRAAVTRATGQAAGSEAWIAAQQALSALDAARAPVVAALGALDALRFETAQRADPIDTTRLDAAYARAEAADAEQRAALDSLTRALPTL